MRNQPDKLPFMSCPFMYQFNKRDRGKNETKILKESRNSNTSTVEGRNVLMFARVGSMHGKENRIE